MKLVYDAVFDDDRERAIAVQAATRSWLGGPVAACTFVEGRWVGVVVAAGGWAGEDAQDVVT